MYIYIYVHLLQDMYISYKIYIFIGHVYLKLNSVFCDTNFVTLAF